MDEFDFEFEDLESSFDFEFDSFVIVEHGGEKYMVKHLLAYDGTSITENGEALTFDQLYSMLMELPDFVVLVHNNYAYHPNGVSREQIVFAASYPVNGYDRAHRITMLASGAVTMTETESEHTSSRVSAITDLNKDSTTKYTSVKAVADYVDPIKEDLSQLEQLMPEANPTVGKVLKVLAVNDDGTFTCEWADGGSDGGVSDVQVNGMTVVQDGVANVALASNSYAGVVRGNTAYGTDISPSTGAILISKATDAQLIGNRTNSYKPIVPSNIDLAVKAAMCDGKGAAWTPEEQAAAQQRLGILSVEEVLF